MKILVLEVDEKDQVLTEALLKDKKHTLVILLNPFDIIKMLKKEHFDIIFIPLEIEGIDSLKFCRRIKQINPGCIMYAFSQQLQVYDTDVLEAVGFDGFLKRPTQKETLKTAVEGAACRLLNGPGMSYRNNRHAYSA